MASEHIDEETATSLSSLGWSTSEPNKLLLSEPSTDGVVSIELPLVNGLLRLRVLVLVLCFLLGLLDFFGGMGGGLGLRGAFLLGDSFDGASGSFLLVWWPFSELFLMFSRSFRKWSVP